MISSLVSIDFSEDLNITISGGPMKNVYVLAQVTWHWGEAEHAIGNEKCASKFSFVSSSY